MKQKINPFKIAQSQIDRAAKLLKLDSAIHILLREPMREIHVLLPVKMDDGSLKVFKGFRVQHNNTRGPFKGGIRFHPEETIDTIRALAAWMTWKCAIMGLPLGGAKGGVICDPREMSEGELERLSRAYVRALWQVIGPETDIPAPDVYTNSQTMAWMMDEYSKIVGHPCPAVITGKPLELGGSLLRDEATARGAIYTIREAAEYLKMNLKKAKVAVQGYGNAGSFGAILSQKILGAKVVAISDSKGGIYKKEGLEPRAVLKYKKKNKSVVNFPGAKNISNEKILELDVDILMPAALENVIHKGNANKIKARIIAEAANGPTTPEADDILYKNGLFVIPDFLCNAGGVTVSYFEWVQNRREESWNKEEVDKKLKARMTKAFKKVLNLSLKKKVNMRVAGYAVALSQVVEALNQKGLEIRNNFK